MTLIVCNGDVRAGDNPEILSGYGSERRTRVRKVSVFGFERFPFGYLSVHWSNGAVGNHCFPTMTALYDWLNDHPNWPKPNTYTRSLPAVAGYLYYYDFEKKAEEQKRSSENVVKRVVRQRSVEAGLGRHSISSEPPRRVRRIRAEG
jgi:hypothetical protein